MTPPHGVRRDPQTGKFMSVNEVPDGRRDTYIATLSVSVPAADLTTGNDSFQVDGDEVIAVDLEEFLDGDEAFAIHYVTLESSIDPNRTATAEHNALVHALLTTDLINLEFDAMTGTPTEEGAVDIRQAEYNDEDILAAHTLTGSGDFADSAAGVGAGADQQVVETTVNFAAAELPLPVVDDDDDFMIPTGLLIRGADDQGVGVRHTATIHGTEFEIG